jgi:hypothetical protein
LGKKEFKMKKYLILAGIVALAILALGAVNLVNAQSETPSPDWNPGFGSGMMGGHRGFGGWGEGYRTDEEGPLHEYMIAAFAEAIGLSPDEIETRHEAGETMWQIADSEGIYVEEFIEIMTQVRSEVIDQVFTDGVLTQEQADFLRQRWSQRQSGGFGPGSGYCMGEGEGLHRGYHGRWNTP